MMSVCPKRMGVPSSAGTGLKGDARAIGPSRWVCLEEWINPDCSGKPVRPGLCWMAVSRFVLFPW